MESLRMVTVSLLISSFITSTKAGEEEYPPQFSKSFIEETLYYQEMENVILKCNVTSNPPPRFSWFFNGQPISSDHVEVDTKTGDLKIASLTKREEGTYRCRASTIISNKTIAALSPIINIRIAFIDSWTKSLDVPRITASEGDPVSITCNDIPDSAPTGEIQWYRQDEDNEIVLTNKRISIDNQGTLHFLYVLKSDDIINQGYKCAIMNRKLGTVKLGSHKILDVKISDSITERAPSSMYVSGKMKAVIGSSVELECIFGASPLSTLSWTDNYHMPIENRDRFEIKDFGRILRIKEVLESDEGTFSCKAQNKMGTAEESVMLNVTSGPIWIEALQSKLAVENGSVQFTCKARGARNENMLESPTWLENGFPLSKPKYKYEFSENKQILTIKNLIKPDDDTCFQCFIKNDVGSVFSNGCLRVVEASAMPSPPFTPKLQSVNVSDYRKAPSQPSNVSSSNLVFIITGVVVGTVALAIIIIVVIVLRKKYSKAPTSTKHFYNEITSENVPQET